MKCLLLLLLLTPLFAQDPVTEAPIEVNAITEDTRIGARLTDVFSAIDDLVKVEVAVNQGVVTLSGMIPSNTAREQALKLTEKADGVVFVQDRMEGEVEVEARLAPAKARAQALWKETLQKSPLILIALTCVALGWIVGAWVNNRHRWFQKLGLNELSASLVGRVLNLLIFALGVFVALEILDATAIAAGVLGVAGVAGIALGFAFRNIVENYLAGILLSMRNPFSTGDAVELGSHSGKVIRLTSRDTVLMTMDGNHLRIPNSLIMTSALINFSRNPLRRFDFGISVSTELNLVDARDLGFETLSEISGVLADPAPQILIESLGASAVNMRFYGWVDQGKHDFMKTKSEAIRLVKTAFDNAGMEMPEPIYRVHLRQADQAPAPKPVPNIEETQESDLSVDHTIDRQLAAVRSADGEANLLGDESPTEESE